MHLKLQFMINNTKLCPFCSEEIKATAIKCRYCFSDLGEKDQLSGLSSATPSGSHPSTPSAHTPLTGIHLVNHALGDRYEILEEIARGGMATVYKAIQKSLKRPVALKVVHQNLLHDTEFVARFHREAKLCASLNHPNIVTVYDEGEVSGVHFMAMEHLEGTDLHRLIRSRERLTPEQTLQYLLPVAEALDYAHGKGYVHRDIKSANISITGSGRVVLMDFGIAHAAAGTQLTRAGTVLGTPEYMSPEQAEGKKVDHKTDLYSLGVVMYECLAGRVPFSGENAMITIFQLTRNEPDDKPLRQTPTSTRELVTALLRKKPENRPSSAQSIAEGMKLLQRGKKWQPPGVESIKSAAGSKSTTEKKQESHTVKLGSKSGKPTSEGDGSPQKEKKKAPATVWFLILLGLVLVFVLVHQYNEQQRVREQKERARIEEQSIEERRREEERKARLAEQQERLAEEQRQREKWEVRVVRADNGLPIPNARILLTKGREYFDREFFTDGQGYARDTQPHRAIHGSSRVRIEKVSAPGFENITFRDYANRHILIKTIDSRNPLVTWTISLFPDSNR